jgi:chemotaxis methyl-accepting protein methylase
LTVEEKLIIKQNSFDILIRLLKGATGLNLDYYRRTFILRRLKARMIRVHCIDLDKYNKFLLSNKEELKLFGDSLNINYTYFFRDWDVYATIQKIFLKSLNVEDEHFLNKLRPNIDFDDAKRPKRKINVEQLIKYNESLFDNIERLSLYQKIKSKRKVNPPIYIWSCACATGEEPYSLAMILNNLKQSVPHFPQCEVIASDINKFAIENAKRAVYGEESMRNVSDYYHNKFFTHRKTLHGSEHSLSNDIKKSITLVNEDITKIRRHPWKFDMIFCRNLLIYFNIENRNKFLKIIEKQLSEGGLLVLGKTESLFNTHGRLKIIDPSLHIYVKASFDK